MAAKVLFLLALMAAVAYADECNCKPPSDEETQDVWKFLSKLSDNVKDQDPEDKEMQAVHAGLLSPLLGCNCMEKNRRKRKIMLDAEAERIEKTLEVEHPQEVQERVREKKYIHQKSPGCPVDHVWIGIMCVPESKMKDLDLDLDSEEK